MIRDSSDPNTRNEIQAGTEKVAQMNLERFLTPLNRPQFCELLSGIGFAPADLTMQALKRQARGAGGDAVEQATGPEFNANAKNLRLLVNKCLINSISNLTSLG